MQKNVIIVALDKQTQQVVAWTHSLRKLEEWEINLQQCNLMCLTTKTFKNILKKMLDTSK